MFESNFLNRIKLCFPERHVAKLFTKKTSYSVQGCSDQFLSISAELFVQLCFNLFTPVFVAAVVVVVVVVAAVVAVAACLAETGTRLHS